MFRAYFFLLMHLTKRVPFLWILSQTGDFVCLRSYKRRGKTSEATCSDVVFFCCCCCHLNKSLTTLFKKKKKVVAIVKCAQTGDLPREQLWWIIRDRTWGHRG